MILELDLGNTRCKWRVLNRDGVVLLRGIGDMSNWLLGNFPNDWSGAIKRVRIASVLSEGIEQNLTAAFASRLQCSLEWARSSQNCAGVHSGYLEPGRLGVDRWLAMIAAYQQCQSSVLVVDIGSALTVDLVNRAGLHCGGYIIPGPRLMGAALLQATDRVRFEQSDRLAGLDFGHDTASCVQSGISAAVTGAVLLARASAESQLAEPVAALVSGGYAKLLINNLKMVSRSDWQWCPELVLDGLRWALP